MDPIHIRPSELEYELTIRNVQGLTNSRSKTMALRDFLKKEAMGIVDNPVDSSGAYTVSNELTQCSNIAESIYEVINKNIQANSLLMCNEAEHRIIHLKGRLKRLHPETEADCETLEHLKVKCDELVRLMSEGGRPSIERRISFHVPSRASAAATAEVTELRVKAYWQDILRDEVVAIERSRTHRWRDRHVGQRLKSLRTARKW